MQSVQPPPVAPGRLRPLIGDQRADAFDELARQAAQALRGHAVWNVNSTATGGGVAEMLAQLVAYGNGAGVDTRWLVMSGDPEFFRVTKRLHNLLHGEPGDGGPLGAAERAVYDRTTAQASAEFREQFRPGDLVIVHDPQPAGLLAVARDAGAHTIWRCHVGRDDANDCTDAAWSFLAPLLEAAEQLVFSRRAFVPRLAEGRPVTLIPPAIDPFSAKNAALPEGAAVAILQTIGVLAGTPETRQAFRRSDGTEGLVTRTAEVMGPSLRPTPEEPLVAQVSRWDRLKDPAGVLRGFADAVTASGGARAAWLLLVGPSVAGVSDDPEGQQVLVECRELLAGLPRAVRERVLLVTLPMDDVEENAAMVNAVQQHAAVVVQKSIVEGFGLTVAEAMWKGRPVVASAVGGIADQIVDGENGLLLRDPRDLAMFAAAVNGLLADPERAARLGRAAKERVRDRFLPDRQLIQWANVLTAGLAHQVGSTR